MKFDGLLIPALVLTGLVASALGAGARQTTGTKTPPLMIASMHGADLFNHYCASCHGRDGKGQGPAATALKTPPPDLTTLARSQNGFPRARVTAIVGGEAGVSFAPAHGSREMPVWGPIFRYLDANRAVTDLRIDNLVAYIGSLQVK